MLLFDIVRYVRCRISTDYDIVPSTMIKTTVIYIYYIVCDCVGTYYVCTWAKTAWVTSIEFDIVTNHVKIV